MRRCGLHSRRGAAFWDEGLPATFSRVGTGRDDASVTSPTRRETWAVSELPKKHPRAHRSDIQGLRAVGVVLVVCYHADTFS